jgi:uncharacterized membrane protein
LVQAGASEREGPVREHLRSRWRDLLDSLWWIPSLIALGYAALALLLLQADSFLGFQTQGQDAWAVGGADGARGVLFAIAGTSLSVLSVVFSLTIVVLQIASAQFTPRVMRTLTGDRGTHIVLGVFLGTFTYALLVLRVVRSPNESGGGPGFVPVAAVTVAIALALVSVIFMIYYINHVARSVQVAVIFQRVTDDTLALLDDPLAGEAKQHAATNPTTVCSPAGDGLAIPAPGDGYLQAIDAESLLGCAQKWGLTVRTDALVGSFLLAGAPLATIWPAAGVTSAQIASVQGGFVQGAERTRQQDAELGVRQLADIAVRALSPAVNDPTTAMMGIDRLGQVLVRAAGRPEVEVLTGAEGACVMLVGTPFARLVEVAFTQIRHYGAGDVMVALHLLGTLQGVATRVSPYQREALVAQAEVLVAEARQSLRVASDIRSVELAATWAMPRHHRSLS